MKSIVLQPTSLVAGALISLAGMLVVAAQTPQVQSSIHLPPRVVEHRIVGIPDPNDMVVLRQEDGPYTVPTGVVLAVTALGTGEGGSTVRILLNGVVAASREQNFTSPEQPFATMAALPVGLTARAGDIIELVGQGGAPRAWGYLSVERP